MGENMGLIRKSSDGKIVFLRRDDSPRIYYRIKNPVEAGWIQRSAGTSDLDEAERIAQEHHDEIRFLAKHGMALVPKAFSAVASMYITELKSEIAIGERKPRNLKDYAPIVERYFKVFFGKRPIDTIQSKDIAAYKDWRARYWIDGPGSKEKYITYERGGKLVKRPAQRRSAPSKQTMNVENVVLRGIFDTALKHDHIKQHQLPNIPKVKQTKDLTKRRAAFTKQEYETLTDFLQHWADPDPNRNTYQDELDGRINARHEEHLMRRWLLRNYVLFLLHSGLRPGTETDNLQWKHVQEIKNSRGENRVKLTVQGKRGLRYPVISPAARAALYQIRVDNLKDGKFPGDDEYVFTLKNGKRVKNDYFRQLFRKALEHEECDLLEDDIGRQRSLYCLRHTYATNQLVFQKVSIYTLAEQMGTSVQMIERHYGHLTPELAVDELTNGSVDDEYDMAAWVKREAERQAKYRKVD